MEGLGHHHHRTAMGYAVQLVFVREPFLLHVLQHEPAAEHPSVTTAETFLPEDIQHLADGTHAGQISTVQEKSRRHHVSMSIKQPW